MARAFQDSSRPVEFAFERWTLLERIIRQFIPRELAQTHCCYLDGFDIDQFRRFGDDAFIGVGRTWHLPQPGGPGDISVVMAIEIDRTTCAVLRGGIWIGAKPLRGSLASNLDLSNYAAVFHARENLGPDWEFAFGRDARGWFVDPDFELARMLLPRVGAE